MLDGDCANAHQYAWAKSALRGYSAHRHLSSQTIDSERHYPPHDGYFAPVPMHSTALMVPCLACLQVCLL